MCEEMIVQHWADTNNAFAIVPGNLLSAKFHNNGINLRKTVKNQRRWTNLNIKNHS